MVKKEKKEQNSGLAGKWLKLSFLCPTILVEAASDLLAVHSGSGVEQGLESEAGSWLSGYFYIEAGVEAACQEQVKGLVGAVQTALAELFALFNQPLPEFRRELLADEDWATSWQQHFKTFTIAPGLVIKPSWEEYVPRPGEQILEMDPGMAFGTGQHASTRGALYLIERSFRRDLPGRVLDVGTGTGILAMGAALWGAGEVLAIDNDPEAVRVARENVAHNRLSDQITVAATPLAEVKDQYDLILANIVYDVLVEMQPLLSRLAAQSAQLVLAGILAGSQEDNIIRWYDQAGFHLLERTYEEEWVALRFARYFVR
ncbi:MAG: 50S ribosomal protein L11 methyltransferase [Desulfobulbus sp.]|jgi:ribosomal protein L11 methyltransferase